MEEKHVFSLRSEWIGDGDGDGSMSAEDRCFDYGRPASLGGTPGRTNPEELLTAAVASCYTITLAVMAEGRRLPITRIDMEAEGEIIRQPDRSLKFTAIRLKPRITVAGDETQQKKALDAAHRAEEHCLISKTLRGNVDITLEPVILPAEILNP
ncbi:MAG TPA: OsmC family protein [Armatimonadota bacterium]|jgi:peroxiredoxin-like protein